MGHYEAWVRGTAELSDGEVSWGFVRDEDSSRLMIQLRLTGADGSARTTRIPDHWYGNIGDSQLSVTPDESHAVLYLNSGQSEAECMVFRLGPELEFRIALPVADEPVCSPESRFVGGLDAGRGFAIDDEDREWWDPPEGPEPVFELARVEVYDLTTGDHHSHPVWITFRGEHLGALAEEGDDVLEQWVWDSLDGPRLELGRDGRGVVAVPLGRFAFTLPGPSAESVVLGASCASLDDVSATYSLRARP